MSTYIDKPELIPILLDLGWTIHHNKWTNCPEIIYCKLTEDSEDETIQWN